MLRKDAKNERTCGKEMQTKSEAGLYRSLQSLVGGQAVHLAVLEMETVEKSRACVPG